MTDELDDDFTVQVINRFNTLTGRLSCSPADYGQAQEWEATGMPVGIVLLALTVWADVNKSKRWLRRAPLEWLDPMVMESYASWRRAVGPSYRVM